MARIEKKAWPDYFEPMLAGRKNFDLRLGDWDCKEGDVLILREWDPKTKKYTGRRLEKKVTYVAKFKIENLFWPAEEIRKHGIQVISLK